MAPIKLTLTEEQTAEILRQAGGAWFGRSFVAIAATVDALSVAVGESRSVRIKPQTPPP